MRPKNQRSCFGLPNVLVFFLLFILISSFLVIHRLVVVSQEIEQENLAQQQGQGQNLRAVTKNQHDVNSEEKKNIDKVYSPLKNDMLPVATNDEILSTKPKKEHLHSPKVELTETLTSSSSTLAQAKQDGKDQTIFYVNNEKYEYIGCWEDRLQDRDIQENAYTIAEGVNVISCIKHCGNLGYPFAALQYGTECRCAESWGRYRQHDDKDCEYRCANGHDMPCGGYIRNALYVVPKKLMSDTLTRQWKQSDEKYFTFAHNSGRTNNQLRSLETGIAYAKYYNRTLILIYPRKRQDLTGLNFGYWDIEHLRKHVKIKFEDEVESILQGKEPKSKKCSVRSGVKFSISDKMLKECLRIHLMSENGVERFGEMTKGIFSTHFRPAKYIRDATEEFLQTHFKDSKPRIGVHNRIMKEGAPDSDGNLYLCRQNYWSALSHRGKWLQKEVKSHYPKNYDEIMNTYFVACAMSPEDVNTILKYHNITELDGKEPFFLATDNQVPAITEKLDEVGAVRWTPERFQNYSRCKEQYEKQRTEHNCADIKGEGLDQTACLWEKYFCRVELAVFDMWTLRLADFMIGCWKSTATESACFWRGWENREKSNMCYIQERWANVERRGGFF